MWHNHFATSIQKVGDPALMRRQNETCRRFARKPFGELLAAMARDPALLIWLDAPANRKGHPNENLARELMELFTLGIGHYTESDVKETARALTGWTVTDGEFREVASRHDDGDKTILGKAGRWGGGGRGPDPPGAAGDGRSAGLAPLRPLHGRRGRGQGPRSRPWPTACERITSISAGPSRRSSAPAPSSPRRTCGRASWARSSSSSARCAGSSCSTRRPARSCWPTGRARLGQDLFNPPNVGGWPGGRSWLSARSLIGRANFAAALVEGRGVGRDAPLDPIALARRYGRGRDGADAVRFCAEVLTGTVAG